jgi:hypothetical protein
MFGGNRLYSSTSMASSVLEAFFAFFVFAASASALKKAQLFVILVGAKQQN